jgi:hypothetical protein
MHLMGPTRTSSLSGKKYIQVIAYDYSWYTWVLLLREKSDAFEAAQQLFEKIQIKQNCPIVRIRNDRGKEFENARFEEYCHSYGIQQEFSSPITPQQNGVVERKNRVLQEMARVMIHSQNLAQHFWGEAINTACHIINRVYLRPETSKTSYEIWRGKKPLLNNYGLLVVYAIFYKTGKIWESLIPKVMKAYSWDTPPTVVPTKSIIPEQKQ